MEELIIDTEIQSKIPALTEDEFKQLEENILEEGQILEPIICWNNTIIDGHNRYKIAREHPEIPFQVKRIDFEDKYEAIVWMCHNQLGRRNLTRESRRILIGTAFEAQMKTKGGDRRSSSFQSTESQGMKKIKNPTRAAIMKQFDAGAYEVGSSLEITRGVNKAEEVSPGFKDSYIAGAINAPDFVVKSIPRVSEDKQPLLISAIKEGDNARAQRIVKEAFPDKFPKRQKHQKPFFEEPEGSFGAEDFGKELQIVVERMDDSFNRYFVREYADMLLQESGRKVAYDALKKGNDILNAYKEVVDSYC